MSIVVLVTAVLLTIGIMMQSKGAGLGAVFGGEGNVYQTKRGAERVLFIATIILAILFAGAAIATLILRTNSV